MLKFDNVENLVSHMFEKLDGEDRVLVVADKDLSVSIMMELLDYNDVDLKLADINDWEYNKEYFVALHNSLESESWEVSIEPAYNYEKEKYFGTSGYVLFHEDVNSRALIDMQRNEYSEISGHDWFVIGEEEEEDNETELEDEKELDDRAVSTSAATYKINGKEVSKDTYEAELGKIEDMYLDNIRDMLLGYAEVMDEVNEWRKLLRW